MNWAKIRCQLLAMRSPSAEDWKRYTIDCIEHYARSVGSKLEEIADYHPAGDLCILAVMGVVHTALLETNRRDLSSCFLQAAAMLEYLNHRGIFNPQALLILVRMYLNLGAVSLAFAAFARLNIKHVQNDSLSHYVLTRISTVHPWPVTGILPPQGNKSDYDADALLARALQVYEKAPEQVFRMTKVAIDHGSYSQVPSFIDLEDKLGTSICKYMWEIEHRRVMRWRNSKTAAAAAKVAPSMLPGRANECPFCWKDTCLK